jgi:threonine synthase
VNKLICKACKKSFSVNENVWQCSCGGVLDLVFQSRFPIEEIEKRQPNMWRYREALPIDSDDNIVSFAEGFTPLSVVPFGNRSVYIKQDYLFPTGSYKDRGASVLISKVKELGVKAVIEDSSGNAGSAIAGYCARGQVDCNIYVPADTSEGKLAQIQLFGAKLHKIRGSREETARSALKAAQSTYYASHTWSPFFFHGTKTFAFEVCEQLGWKAPDALVLPVGNGTLLLGVYIGFNELQAAGITDKVPKIVGVQTKNCAPLFKSFQDGSTESSRINSKATLAEGIAIAEPLRGEEILEAVRMSDGSILAVNEIEIKIALKEMCALGYYIEPTSAAVIAGLKNYLKATDEKDTIVSIFTGNGLKTTEKMLKLIKVDGS